MTPPASTAKSKPRAAPRIGIVSLGCPKALVDSERILTRLRAEGYEIAPSYQRADLVLVNTCGFIDSARAESLDAIGEALEENGKVVVTGCLGAEGGLIREKYPDVLAVTGPHQYEAVMEAVKLMSLVAEMGEEARALTHPHFKPPGPTMTSDAGIPARSDTSARNTSHAARLAHITQVRPSERPSTMVGSCDDPTADVITCPRSKDERSMLMRRGSPAIVGSGRPPGPRRWW